MKVNERGLIITVVLMLVLGLSVRHEHTKDINNAYAQGYDKVVCQVYKDLKKDGIDPNKYVTMDTDTLKGCLGN